MNNKVKFEKGKKAQYVKLVAADKDTFYLLTDTGELYCGDIPLSNNECVKKAGDTMTGPLAFNTKTLPILDLQASTAVSNVYTLTTNGSIFVGDGTSNAGARVYYCRLVTTLGKAILGGVSIGYNPAESESSSNYGIKFDVSVCPSVAKPTAKQRTQVASFFVSAEGAKVGYTNSLTSPLTSAKVYDVLDSHNISKNAYIVALENKIKTLQDNYAALLARVEALENNE